LASLFGGKLVEALTQRVRISGRVEQ